MSVNISLNNFTVDLASGAVQVFGESGAITADDYHRALNAIDLNTHLGVSLTNLKSRFQMKHPNWDSDGNVAANVDGLVFKDTSANAANVDTKLDDKFTKWYSAGENGDLADNAVQVTSSDGMCNAANNAACNLAAFYAKYLADGITGSPEGVAVIANQHSMAASYAAADGVGTQLMAKLYDSEEAAGNAEAGSYLASNNTNLSILIEQMIQAAPSRFQEDYAAFADVPFVAGDTISFKIKLTGSITTHAIGGTGGAVDLATVLANGIATGEGAVQSVSKPFTAGGDVKDLILKVTLNVQAD